MADLSAGAVLKGKYEISKLLAEGGMSRIYVGHPLQGAGMVAIKQLRQPDSPDELGEDVKQFQSEYRILQQLQHPSLPRALDFFEENGDHYLVEEFVPGETLESRIARDQRIQPLDAVGLALSLLDVLEYLHKRRIIYRDLKPSNILLGRDHSLRLVDFGAARFWREGAHRDTVPLGTPGFASPEHYGRAQTDERSDMYSVGAVLHYMITGIDPAEGQPWTFDPPSQHFEDIPLGLSEITLTALSIDPARRFQTVAAMRRALLNLPFDFRNLKNSGAGQARRLTAVRRRLQFNNPQDYYRVLETLGLGLFGVFFFAVSIPAWFANVPLPHPLVGAWLTAYAFVHPYSNWKRYRNMVVEIFMEGMRIVDESGNHEIFWADILRLRLDTPGVVTARAADIFVRNMPTIRIDGVWPGFSEVVQEVVNGAGLVERSSQAPWYSYVDTSEKVYERAP